MKVSVGVGNQFPRISDLYNLPFLHHTDSELKQIKETELVQDWTNMSQERTVLSL